MAHKLVTDEMVEGAKDRLEHGIEHDVIDDVISLESRAVRAALEAVADDIRNQAIEECAKEVEEMAVGNGDTLDLCADHIRSLKRGQ